MVSRLLASAGLALIVLPVPALADPDDYVPVEAREIEPARPVAVLVPQSRIASSIELGRIMFPSWGGGMFGAIFVDGQNSIPERLAANALARAEVQIAPLVEVLDGFDIATIANDAALAAIEAAPWFGAGSTEVLAAEGDADGGEVNVSTTYNVGLFGYVGNQTTSSANWAADVSAAQDRFRAAYPDAPELAQVLWRYQMSPDFSQVQVIADISLARQGAAAFYNQQLISIVRLHRPSYAEEENVARWTANDGEVVRAALASAFARAGEVMPHLLALDEGGFDEATDRRRESVTSAGYHGPVLLRDETGPVFFARDADQRLAAFVTVQLAAE